MALKQFGDFNVATAGRPGERSGPRWIVAQVWFCASVEEELDHFGSAEFGGPAKRGGTEIIVAGVQFGAVVEKEPGFFNVTAAGEMVKRRGAEPIGHIGIHAVLEKKLVEFARFCAEGGAFGEI